MKTWKHFTFMAFFAFFGIAVVFTACDNGTTEFLLDDEQEWDDLAPFFSKGVSFFGRFDKEGIEWIKDVNRYREQDFANVKSLGIDVIRLPIDFNFFTSDAPRYTLYPSFLNSLDRLVYFANKYQIYIILDNHPDGQPLITENYQNFLIPVWTQMAEYYKNRSKYIVFEILNEPNANGIFASNWGEMQREVINAIRMIDQNHWIVVSGLHVGEDPAVGLSALPKYTDNKLLYTFHFYEPHIFTLPEWHAFTMPDWVKDYDQLALPFPYDKDRMPVLPSGQAGTEWIEERFKNYPNEATTEVLTRKIDKVSDFMKQRNVPVFCGEFGADMMYARSEDRIRYYKFVRETLEARSIPWIMWQYFDKNGLFNPPNGKAEHIFKGDFNKDLNVELVRALGLTLPPQR